MFSLGLLLDRCFSVVDDDLHEYDNFSGELAVIKGPTDSEAHCVRFGVFEADLQTGELRKSGIRLKLQSQPFKVLSVLLDRPGHIVSREELQRALWGLDTTVDFEHGLGTAVNKLRDVLGDSASTPRYIETLSRRGYRFIAPVEPVAPRSATVPTLPPNPILLGQTFLPSLQPPVLVPDRKAFRWARNFALGFAAIAAAVTVTLLQRRSASELTQADQITWSGHVYPGDLSMERFANLLTDGGRIYFPLQQNGGLLIGYASIGHDEINPPISTLVIPPEISHPSLTDISSDGSQFLVQDQISSQMESPLWIVPTAGGAARRIANVMAHDATWMPDGQSILYAYGHELSTVDKQGRNAQRFAHLPGRAFWLRWSPDKSRLRLSILEPKTHEASLWELSAHGDNLSNLFTGLKNPQAQCCGSWTPDGRYFIFQSLLSDGRRDIWAEEESRSLFSRRPSMPVRLTAGPLSYVAPVVSGHGDRILVIGAHSHTELLRYNSTTHEFDPYLAGLSTAGKLATSPDGLRVAWVSAGDGSAWQSLPDGSQRLQLSVPPLQIFMLRWSPDGKRIALMGKRPGEPWKIFTTAAEGGNPQPLLDEGSYEADPSWSPDSDSIAFGRSADYMGEESAPKAIYILNVKTRAMKMVPGSGGLFSPRWSPDGRYIAALSLDQRRLMLFDTRTAKWTQIAAGSADNPAWSSDSKSIFFHAFMEEYHPIYRLRLSDRNLERLADFRDVRRADALDYSFAGLSADGMPIVAVNLWTSDIYSLKWPNPAVNR